MTIGARIAGLIIAFVPLAALAQEAASQAQPPGESAPAAPAGEPEVPAMVRVSGVETLNDYALVERLLGAAGGKHVDVTEAEGQNVTFRVMVRGGSEALQRSLESAGQLTRSGASAGHLQYELKR